MFILIWAMGHIGDQKLSAPCQRNVKTNQQCIPVGCVPPDPPRQRPPLRPFPLTEIPRLRPLPGQRPLPGHGPPWTETPLDRDLPGQRPPGQRPS